jgi:hypothetical protein
LKNKKKKLPEYIFPVIAIGLFILGFYIANTLNLPESFLCGERVGICAIPILGKVIAMISSPTAWVGFTFYGITFGGFLIVIQKKGYKI